MIGILVLEAVVGEFSPPTASPMGMPWDFHEKCRASFEVRGRPAAVLIPDAELDPAYLPHQTRTGGAGNFAGSSPLL